MRIKNLKEGPKRSPVQLYRGQDGMLHRASAPKPDPAKLIIGQDGLPIKSDPKMVHSRPNYSSIDDLQHAAEREYHAQKKLDDLKALGPPESKGFNFRKYMDLLKKISGEVVKRKLHLK